MNLAFIEFFLVCNLALVRMLSLDDFWTHYKHVYHKKYSSDIEDQRHKAAFYKSIHMLISPKEKNFTLGLNKFADEPLNDFKTQYSSLKGKRNNKRLLKKIKNDVVGTTKNVDWREFGFVTRVRDQGKCGACYAIATVGALEGVYSRFYKAPVEFSVQELVDCSRANNGCDGGWLGNSYDYISGKKLQWPELEASYQYSGEKAECKAAAHDSFHGLRCIGHLSLENNDEYEIYEALLDTPVPSAIITTPELILYENGILEGVCKDTANIDPDHAVLIIGFGKDSNGGYWIIKNSWGDDWGEDGYFRLRFGKNECKIASDNVVPIVAYI